MVRLTLIAIFVGLIALPGSAEGSCAVRDWRADEFNAQHQEQPIAQDVAAEPALPTSSRR